MGTKSCGVIPVEMGFQNNKEGIYPGQIEQDGPIISDKPQYLSFTQLSCDGDCSISFLLLEVKIGRINRAISVIIKPREIGRVKKMVRPPYDIINESRNAFSGIGHRTRAKTKRAASYSNLFIKYPKLPKRTIIIISSKLLFKLYAPIKQKRRIKGNNTG
jgi:hypothetical protein